MLPRFARLFGVAVVALLYVAALTRLLEAPPKWIVVFALAAAAPVLLAIFESRRQILLGLLTLALALPYLDFNLFYDPTQGGDFRVNINLLDGIVLMFLLFWLWEASQSKAFSPGLSGFTIACFVALFSMGVLSLFWAPNAVRGVFELVRLAKAMLLCGVIAHFVRSEDDVKAVLVALLLVIFLEGGVALLQQFRGHSLGLTLLGEAETLTTQELGRAESYSRVGGTLGHPNRLAMFLEFLLPTVFALVLSTQGPGFGPNHRTLRAVSLGGLSIGGIALLYTLSRAGWLAFAVSSVVVLVLLWHSTLGKRHLARKTAVVVFVLVCVGGVFSGLICQRFTSDDLGAFSSRRPLIRVALSMIRDHPLAGTGIGNYREWLSRYHDPEEPFTRVSKVHNVFLLVAAEMGTAALAIFLLLFVRAWWKSWRGLANLSEPSLTLAIGILGGFLAFAVHGLVDYIEIARFPGLWFGLGLLEALPRTAWTQTSHDIPR